MKLYADSFESPIGIVEVVVHNKRVAAIRFVERAGPAEPCELTARAMEQLKEYFHAGRQEFDLPLARLGTDFQRSVWDQLMRIPYGQTCSYGELAAALSNPKAVRAVGTANANNPHAIVVPCHRVIASSGKLSGYAGGVERKAWLINHETGSLF